MSRHRIAVLLTCHNRRATTLACLERLAAQSMMDADSDVFQVEMFLVDDGSTDGSGDAVRERFPAVHVLAGTGHLYWCGGMRLAFATARATSRASAEPFSHYLWLNDDTLLHGDALARLLVTHEARSLAGDSRAIVVGSTTDPTTGALSYGGLRRRWPWPYTAPVPPGDVPRRCDTMHGNCVLVPANVAQALGNLDPDLTHGRGDIDYGLRATKRGIDVWVAPGFYGTCEGHPVGDWQDSNQPLRTRLAALRHPKYAIDEKILVARRHYGVLWFLSPLAVYVYIVATQPMGWIRRWLTRKSS